MLPVVKKMSSRAATVVAAVWMAGGLLGQPPATPQPYQPAVGQAGKDVVWVPSPEAMVEKMLDMAKVTADDVLMDLGSGEGRIVIAAAKRGARGIGVEYNPELVELSRKNAAAAGVSSRASFVQADVFQTDLTPATVLTLFLLPSLNVKLRPTILDLKPGTRVVSNSFAMEDWEADEQQTVNPCVSLCTALLWIVPAPVQGRWHTPKGVMTLSQKYQTFVGTLGDDVVTKGRLRGPEISFVLGNTTYTGRVNGFQMVVSSGALGDTWIARRQ
jgi:hypothetical protein